MRWPGLIAVAALTLAPRAFAHAFLERASPPVMCLGRKLTQDVGVARQQC